MQISGSFDKPECDNSVTKKPEGALGLPNVFRFAIGMKNSRRSNLGLFKVCWQASSRQEAGRILETLCRFYCTKIRNSVIDIVYGKIGQLLCNQQVVGSISSVEILRSDPPHPR